MARQTPKRRAYIRRPELKETAATLGVGYSHLRRVISGKRESRDLLDKYQRLVEVHRVIATKPQLPPQTDEKSPQRITDQTFGIPKV